MRRRQNVSRSDTVEIQMKYRNCLHPQNKSVDGWMDSRSSVLTSPNRPFNLKTFIFLLLLLFVFNFSSTPQSQRTASKWYPKSTRRIIQSSCLPIQSGQADSSQTETVHPLNHGLGCAGLVVSLIAFVCVCASFGILKTAKKKNMNGTHPHFVPP